MNLFRQTQVATMLSFRSLHTRIKSSLVIVASLVCVIVVLLSILSLGEGVRLAILQSGDANRAVVLSEGAALEFNSALPRAAATLIRNAPGIARSGDGTVLADAEIQAGFLLTKKSNQKQGGTAVMGMGPAGLAMSPELKIIAGRRVQPGRRELMAGANAQEKFTGLELGDKVRLPDGGLWPVVGIYSSSSLMGGYVIADAETLAAALRRSNYNFMLVRLASPDSFQAFQKALMGNPTLSVNVMTEPDYYRKFWQWIPSTPFVIAYVLGTLLAIGAFAGTMNTMRMAVETRENEIAVLRAIGFSGFAVAASVMLEAMLLASLGAVIGTGIDWLWLNGYAYNAIGVFHVAVTLRLLLVALGWALTIAFIGALSPAIKASRVTVIEALRAY